AFDDLLRRVVAAKCSSPFPRRSVAVVSPLTTPLTLESEAGLWPRPEVSLYGVDFSGGKENQRSGNRKIWVAKWIPGKKVKFADKICRADLPTLIKCEPGWWSLDFPFGIAK